jgi:hypothetical protein
MTTKQPDSSGSVVIRPWVAEREKLFDARWGGGSQLLLAQFPDKLTQLPMKYCKLYSVLKAVSSCNTTVTRLAEDSAKLDLCLPSALTSFRCGAHFSIGHLIHSCRPTPEFRPELGVYKPEFWFGLCVAKETQSHRLCNDCVLFTSVKCQTLSMKT